MKLGNLPMYQSKYLSPSDLQGRAVRVTIEKVTLEEMYNRAENKKEKQAVLWFAGKQKGLIINRTRLAQLVGIFGTDESDRYHGQQVILTPSKQAGKDTIHIHAAPVEAA